MKGNFIAFDGANGVGKSTIINAVYKKLINSSTTDIIKTKEPTDTLLGEFILKNVKKFSNYQLACLVTADRYGHLNDVIIPELENNKIVLCDRYLLSSLILQGLDGVSDDFILNINKEIRLPDLYVVLYASDDKVRQRVTARGNLTEFEEKFSSKQEVDRTFESIDILKNNLDYNNILMINTDNDFEKNVELICNNIILCEKSYD
ncbi:MAG: dTMP kinase [Longicatena sp.]|uniref:dTMP kinase n=1 Tax=Anaerorhabdus sp. TaxID=1872524 RepID=UPI002FC8376A